MKHLFQSKTMAAWITMLLVTICALPERVAAQIIFQEDFDYPVGDLQSQGGWVRYGSNAEAPIQVLDKQLSYPGYNDDAPAKSVKITSVKSGEDLMMRFTDDDEGVKSGNLYFSALINVESQPQGNVYVMAFVPRTKKSVIAAGINPVELGRLFIGEGTSDDEVKIGVERGAANPVFSDTPLKLNQTYLVVLRYEINSQDKGKDNVYLYVNPANFKKEPANPNAVIDGVNQSGSGLGNYGLQGFELRQGTNATVTSPELYVASVRISDTFAGLFGEKSEDKTPRVGISKKNIILGDVYTGDEYSETVTVTGENLTGDISVESSSPAVTVSPATLSAADAMSGDGAQLKINVAYTEGTQNAVLTLKSEGAADSQIKISWTGYTVPEIKTLKALYSEDPEQGLTYNYTGEAVVSFVDRGGDKPVYYLQDETGAITLSDEWDILTKTDYNVGDKLTGVILGIQDVMGTISAMPFNRNLGKVLSTGNVVVPVEATLSQLKASPADYLQQVVKVKDLKFKDVAEGATFAEGMKQPVVTDGTEEANVRIFKGTSLIGTAIPTADVTLTGLFTSKKMLIIGPRGAEDIVEQQPQGEPVITITPEKITQAAGALGKTIEVATIHVSAQNMKYATTFELAGKNADQFSISQSTVEKGSTETDIVISYTPTEVAVHKAYLMVNCPSIEDYYKTINFSAYAIDEQNPPTITLNPTALEPFTAKVNESSEQTIEVTTANMPDYTYVKVKDAGQFILSNTMLLRNMANTVKITFQPKVEGTYSTALVFSALGMEDVEVPISGVATGEPQEEPKEGVDFVLSDENPLTELNETFDNIDRNKPLALDRWTNSAIIGTRAWWGYSFPDYDQESPNEKVAKVTPFDSKMESGMGVPVQMMLVTPPLDFKNAKNNIFTFRVRGDYLQDNQTDKLELCYVDITEGEPYIQPLTECRMPCTKDESGKWYPYTVDLTGQQLADVFFMAFRFTSTRGCDNAATYYVDDVTYSQETSGISTLDMTEKARVSVYDLAGNKVAEMSDATAGQAVGGLAKGMYIIKTVSANGIKTGKVQIK